MASGFFSPPSSYLLSDQVIGSVVQRAGSLHARLGLTNEQERRAVECYTKPRQAFNSISPAVANSSTVGRLPPRRTSGWKRQSGLDALAQAASKRNGDSTPEHVPPTPASMTLRERGRVNQARDRKGQRQHAADLDASIRQLQEEIKDLETQHRNMVRLARTNESVWIVATESFRLFRFGYVVPPESPFRKTDAQLDFLKTYMAPDVANGGVDGLLESWKLMSMYGGNVQVQLKRLEQVGVDTLLATTATSVTLTEDTLRHVFPHLIKDAGETSSKLSPLANKLKNQRLVLCGAVRFDWDSASGRVARLESEVDLLSPMLHLLGSLEAVARVFDQALITLDGNVVANVNASE
jgi:hypothetical protein